MNTILSKIGNWFDVFDNVATSFSGNYTASNLEIVIMKHELENENIPTICSDRRNLKEDSLKVAKDYRKAFEAKKSELSI